MVEVPSATRGSTTIHPRVLHALAVEAVLSVPGCVRHASGLARLAGRPYPQVEVRALGTGVDAQVLVAVEWPCVVAEVARVVRAAVVDELTAATGIPVVRVDVHVGAVVPGEQRLDAVTLPLTQPERRAARALRSPGPVPATRQVKPASPVARTADRPTAPPRAQAWSPNPPSRHEVRVPALLPRTRPAHMTTPRPTLPSRLLTTGSVA